MKFQLSEKCAVSGMWKSGIGHDSCHCKMKKIFTVGIELVLTLLVVGCKMSEGRDDEKTRRAQVSATVVAGMRQQKVKEFSGKTGENLSDVVGRLHQIARSGLPGLPEDRNGISIILKTLKGDAEKTLLTSDFSVKDVSLYEAVDAFCKSTGYQFKIDGGYLEIFPAGVTIPDIDRTEPTEEELCGHELVKDEERALLYHLLELRLPSISFRPPATLKDAVEFFRLASAPIGEREKEIAIRVEAVTNAYSTQPIPELSATDIPLYEAIKLVADCTGFRIEIRGAQVVFTECVGFRLTTSHHITGEQ